MHPALQIVTRSATKLKTAIFITVLTAASVLPLLANPDIAHAICGVTCTYSDSWGYQEVSGSGWLTSIGGGVPIYSNGPSAPSGPSPDTYNYINNKNNVSTQTGIEWQCVELVNRLYIAKGWITSTWTGNGNQLYANAPSNLTKQANGSITNLAVGDVISMSNGSGFGHAAVVNSVSGSAIGIASQNTNAVYDTTSFTIGSGTISTSWSNYSVIGVIHAPSGSTGSSVHTPSGINVNGTLNVFTVASDNQLYGQYWNGSAWTGFSSIVSNVMSDPAPIMNGSTLNMFYRGGDNQIYNGFKSGSTWSWGSMGTTQMQGNPTAMTFGTGEMDVFALGTDGHPYYDTWLTATGWSGWQSTGNFMASDLKGAQYGSSLYLFARGGDNVPYYIVRNGGTWGSWSSLGGSVVGNPAVLNYGAESELDVYFNTSVNQIWKITYTSSGWGSWGNMGSSYVGDPYLTTYGNDLEVFARGTNNQVYTRYWSYGGQYWTNWLSIGGTNLSSNPTAIQNGSQLTAFDNGSDGKTYLNTNPGSGWGSFVSLP